MNTGSARRAAALLEVIGVFLAGPIVGWLLRKAFGVTVINPLDRLSINITNTELVVASWQMFVLLVFQYGGAFLLIVPMNWWHRRRGLASYGLTKAGRSWRALLAAGLVTAALSTWPVLTVGLVNSIHPSETAPWRQAFFDMSWLRWQFWLFSAVLSWGFVPVAEELLFRGYYQRRLAEDWGNGPAIAATACLFTFAHGQYQIPNLYNLGMIVGLLTFAIGFGVVFALTRSLVPSILAHAIINVPMTLPWQVAIVGALVVGALTTWRPGAAAIQSVFSGANTRVSVALAVLSAASAAAAARVEILAYLIGPAMVFSAIMIEAAVANRSAGPVRREGSKPASSSNR